MMSPCHCGASLDAAPLHITIAAAHSSSWVSVVRNFATYGETKPLAPHCQPQNNAQNQRCFPPERKNSNPKIKLVSPSPSPRRSAMTTSANHKTPICKKPPPRLPLLLVTIYITRMTLGRLLQWATQRLRSSWNAVPGLLLEQQEQNR